MHQNQKEGRAWLGCGGVFSLSACQTLTLFFNKNTKTNKLRFVCLALQHKRAGPYLLDRKNDTMETG